MGTDMWSSDSYAGACIVDGQLMSVTLLPDGTIAATWDAASVQFQVETIDSVETIQCLAPGDRQTVPMEGRHEAGHVVFHEAGNPGNVFFEGDYTGETLAINARRDTDFGTYTTTGTWDYVLDYQSG